MLDGERQVQVAPGWMHGSGLSTPAKAGGFWSEASPTQFNLDVVVMGVEEIVGLKIGIDGKIHEFSPHSLPTQHGMVDGHSESSRRFIVPLDLIEQMVAAQLTVFQVRLPGKVVEANFSFDQQTYARPAFRKALRQIKQPRSTKPVGEK